MNESYVRFFTLSAAPFSKEVQDGDLWLWNEQSGPPVRATDLASPSPGALGDSDFTRPEAEVSTYAWSPDGRYIALHFDDRRKVRTVVFPEFLGDETANRLWRAGDAVAERDELVEGRRINADHARLGAVPLEQPSEAFAPAHLAGLSEE